MLLQLPTLPQVPRPDGVVKTTGPQLGPVRRDVDAAGSVRVALELPHQGLVVKIPHRDVPVAAAAEAHLAVRADGQRVAGGSGTGELSLDARGGGGEVPDGEGACLSSHN